MGRINHFESHQSIHRRENPTTGQPLSAVVVALIFSGCVYTPSSGKGMESELTESGKADSHLEIMDHGSIGFGEIARAEINLSSGIHLWSFEIGDAGATVEMRTEFVADHEPIDTVMYLFEENAEEDDESWGTQILRNDDCPNSNDLYSCLYSVQLDGGHYSVLIKGYSDWDKGWFGVVVDCSGEGCILDNRLCDDVSGRPLALWNQQGVDISQPGVAGRVPTAAADGQGGAFIAYLQEDASGENLRLHHIDAEGEATLEPEGATLLTDLSPDDFTSVTLEADGENGVFVSVLVQTEETGNLTLLRIGQGGETLWGSMGLQLFDDQNVTKARLLRRGGGELILVYNVSEPEGGWSLNAQVLSPEGRPVWEAPVSIGDHSTASWNTSETDGQGGMFVGWLARHGSVNQRVYAAHLDQNGDSLWESPIPISVESSEIDAWGLDIEPDSEGGLYLTWHYTDIESNETRGIYVAHVDSSGESTWDHGGILVVERERATQHFPRVMNTIEGPFVFWSEQHAGHHNVYAQRINRDGSVAFEEFSLGVEIAARISEKTLTGLQFDSCGGFVSTWMDSRLGPDGPVVNAGLQRFNLEGESTFDPSGMIIGDERWQAYPHLSKLGPRSFLVAWASREREDWSYPYGTIQAQRFDIE